MNSSYTSHSDHRRRPLPTAATTKTSMKKVKTRRLNVRNILAGAVLLSLFVALLCPSGQLAEGAKLKKEGLKLLKSLAKGFVVSKLTTRKNFMPLPVPIPGKWQQLLTAAFDSGLLLASNRKQQQQQAQKFNPGSSKKYGSATSIGSDSKSVSKFLASKLIKAAFGSGKSSVAESSTSKDKNSLGDTKGGKSFNYNRVEKRVRITAAKYAGKIIANQLPSKNSGASVGASPLKFSKKLLAAGFHNSDRKSDGSQQPASSTAAAPQNDLLVTAYNLVKFMQQFRELDRAKLLDLNKMSLAGLASQAATNLAGTNRVPPILAMNINNKKTLMNKLNYIHKLSTFRDDRHRRDHLATAAATSL